MATAADIAEACRQLASKVQSVHAPNMQAVVSDVGSQLGHLATESSEVFQANFQPVLSSFHSLAPHFQAITSFLDDHPTHLLHLAGQLDAVASNNLAAGSGGSASGSSAAGSGSILGGVQSIAVHDGWLLAPLAGAIPGVGALQAFDTDVRTGQNLAEGNYQQAFNEGSSTISGDLISEGTEHLNPYMFLSGVLVDEGSQIEQASRNIDWSYQLGHMNDLWAPGAPAIYAQATVQAIQEVGEPIVSGVISGAEGLWHDL